MTAHDRQYERHDGQGEADHVIRNFSGQSIWRIRYASRSTTPYRIVTCFQCSRVKPSLNVTNTEMSRIECQLKLLRSINAREIRLRSCQDGHDSGRRDICTGHTCTTRGLRAVSRGRGAHWRNAFLQVSSGILDNRGDMKNTSMKFGH
jgi:hypothetical protein